MQKMHCARRWQAAVFNLNRQMEFGRLGRRKRKKKKRGFWQDAGPFPDEKSVDKSLSHVRNVFYALAGISFLGWGVLSYLRNDALFLLANTLELLLYLSAAYYIPKRKSRAFSAFVFIWTLFVLSLTVGTKLKIYSGVGSNIYMGIMAAFYGFAALRATNAYHRLKKSEVNKRNVLVVSVAATFYGLIGIAITGVLSVILEDDYHISNDSIDTILGSFVLGVILISFVGVLPFTRNKPFCRFPDTNHEIPSAPVPIERTDDNSD